MLSKEAAELEFGIPFGHRDNSATGGILMWVGDQNESRWQLDFPLSFGSPTTRCYLPPWIFTPGEIYAKARQTFFVLADLEFQGHDHEDCGGTHNRIVRHGEVVLDVPCCVREE